MEGNMIDRNEIIAAYVFLRKNNMDISDQTLDFMKDAALSVHDSMYGDYCKKCIHNGKQMIYPSGCTGCGGNGEGRNFKLNPSRDS
jgi:hypothetical protein